MHEAYRRGDRWMRLLVLAHLVFASVLAPFHDTWLAVAGVGGGLAVTFLAVSRAFPGRLATRVAAGIVLQGFCALHIFQMAGMAEMHFFFFTAVTALIIYQDLRAIWPGVILIILQHVVFHALHNQGVHLGGLRFFEQDEVGHLRMLIHYGIAVFQVGVASYWASTLRAQTLRAARQRATLEEGVETLRDETAELGAANRRLREVERALRTAHHELEEREARFRQLADNIPQVFWIKDLDASRFIYVSPAYEQIWGRTTESLYQDPRSFFGAVCPEDVAEVEGLVAAILTGEPAEGQFRIALPDGSVRWLHARAFPIAAPDGVIRRVAGITEDVTEQRALADQLRQSQKMEAVGRLAGGIAHDFNNMLFAIRGHADFVAEALPAASPMQEDISEIRRAADRAADLTRQLLAFSRKQVLQPRPLNLNESVEGMGAMLRRLIGANIELRSELPPDLPAADADPGQVEQVILNLAVNARDAMPGGGELLVRTYPVVLTDEAAAAHPGARAGAYVALSVTDTGCGMDEGVRERVFEPFFTTKEVGSGTGLGLSTVYGIAQQSGGFVTLATAPGRGSTFCVHFRQSESRANAPDPAVPDARPAEGGAGQTILVVEDEPAIRSLVQRVLDRAGYTVLGADGGDAAARVLQERPGPIDLLLSDVMMPGEGGPEVAARVRRAHPGVRVLFMSGYTGDAVEAEPVLGAVTGFLGKPFTPAALLDAVEECLAAPEPVPSPP